MNERAISNQRSTSKTGSVWNAAHGLFSLSIFVLLSVVLDVRGATEFGERSVIGSSEAPALQDVVSSDLDGDGDQDVLSASGSKIAWYENTDGAGSFGAQQVITTDVYIA